jgi:hypothetical protein
MKNLKPLFITKILLVITTLSIFIFSCKKNKETTPPLPTNFNEINMSTIQAKETAMVTTPIVATNANGFVWQPNDVYIFKTEQNRFGKLQVVSIDAANNNKLTLNAIVYNTDGTVKLTNNALVVRGTWLCDLDLLAETTTLILSDFHWIRVNTTTTEFTPQNAAKFVKYTF